MPYILNKYYPFKNILFFIGEGILIFTSLLFVHWIFKGTPILIIDMQECIFQSLLVTVIFQTCLYFFDLYDLRNDLSMPVTATKITQAFGVGCILLSGVYYILPETIISTWIFWTGYLVIYILVLLWRACYYYSLKKKLFVQSILIIGTGKLAMDITQEVEQRYDSSHKIFAFISNEIPSYNPRNAPVYENLELLHEEFSKNKIDRIIVALDNRRGTTPVKQLLDYKLQGIAIEQGVNFYERITGKILVEKVDPSWIIFSNGFAIGRIQAFGKRCFDISLSLFLLVLTLPVMIVSAIIIRLETPGPIFYSQERVGKGKQVFKVLKFRSMVQEAEENGAVWATANDSRVTRFGGFIRKTRIDELPQLINVLKGEMSLVGPRPERPVFVEKLKQTIPYYDIRHDVSPGVTGCAQVSYPYGASEEDALRKLEYDLYYLKHISMPLDILIILKTVKTVLFGKGAR